MIPGTPPIIQVSWEAAKGARSTPMPQRAQTALAHYEAVLRRTPGSLWANYRAAVVQFTLGDWQAAARHLERCVQRRPDNALLRGQLATCLSRAGRLDLAARECDAAIERAPNAGEYYRTRAFINACAHKTEGLEEDLARFELLGRSLARTFFQNPPAHELGELQPAGVPASRRVLDLDRSPDGPDWTDDPMVVFDRLDPRELDARALVAWAICQAGADSLRDGSPTTEAGRKALDLAAREYRKVLAIQPDHLRARLARMALSVEEGRLEEVQEDLDLILSSSDLPQVLRDRSEYLGFLAQVSYRLAQRGLMEPALDLGRRLAAICLELRLPRGQVHYYRAKVRILAARSDPDQLSNAAEDLHCAILAHPRFRQWYHHDREFDPVRTRLDAALDRMVDAPARY
jgi:tetratricopeptide (TPR) repeat protein